MNNTGCVLSGILTTTLFASADFGQASLTARDVINKMAGVYVQSATYRDEGQVTYMPIDAALFDFRPHGANPSR